MATSSIQPELSNTTVEGYFYKRTTGEADEKNKKYKGASKKAYAVNEFKEKYYESDVIDLNINNDDLNIFANSTAKESSGNKKESYADGREQAIYSTDKRGISADGEFTDDKSKSKKVKL